MQVPRLLLLRTFADSGTPRDSSQSNLDSLDGQGWDRLSTVEDRMERNREEVEVRFMCHNDL